MATLKQLLVLVLALVSTACSADKYSTKFDASSLGEAQRAAVQDAADQWCEETSGVCCPTLTGGANHIEFASMSDRKGNTSFHAGVTTITIRDIYAGDLGLVGRIVRHEFGHACRAANVGELEQSNMTEDWHVMSRSDEVQPAYLTDADVEYVGATPKIDLLTIE
jgi:hypothetical protein